MRKGLLLLMAITSATLVGCAITPAYVPSFSKLFYTTTKCSVQDCPPLPVTVEDCAAGKIIVAEFLDLTPGPAGQQRTVTWTISNETGFEFSMENFKYGIFIKLDGGDEFKSAQLTNGRKTLSIKYDKKADTGTRYYSYALTVRRTDGDKGFCKTLDPWMIS